MITWLQGTVVEKKQWCPELFSLTFKTEPLAFKAGQFILIGLDIDGTVIYRPYSLVSTPDNDLLEIHFNTVKDGALSPLLGNLNSGDTLQVSNRPSGLLTIEDSPDAANLWLVATGTGIGPFIPILKMREPWRKFDKIVLCYAVKTAEGMAYRADFEALSARYPDQFSFMPFVTREVAANTLNCRVTTYLESGELEERTALALSAESCHVMLCGNASMINDMTILLENKGLRRHSRSKPGQIAIEKYY